MQLVKLNNEHKWQIKTGIQTNWNKHLKKNTFGIQT